MKIQKRDNTFTEFNPKKIEIALKNAFSDVKIPYDNNIFILVLERIDKNPTVEKIQDIVEEVLMSTYSIVAKAYIIYRERRSQLRKLVSSVTENTSKNLSKNLEKIFIQIEKNFDEKYSLDIIIHKFKTLFSKTLKSDDYVLDCLIKGTSELTSMETPKFELISALFLNLKYKLKIKDFENSHNLKSFYDKLVYLTENGLYSPLVLKKFTMEEIHELSRIIDNTRDELLNYSGLDLLYKRYVIRTHNGDVVESIQEMFLGIAMFLGMNDKVYIKDFYDVLSKLKITVATPTLANARKTHHQLSSCFIDTVPDSLDGIYQSISNFANVSKHGGGMGMYLGKIRAMGSDIRGFKGASGGVLRWIKIINDTAVAVDQLGVRQGACAVYLDLWHRDLPEFLQLRTNNGDDRMKAHDVFPAICVPNYFWDSVNNDVNGTWYLMCPHEIYTAKGYYLEDFYGDEWVSKYHDCIKDSRIEKRSIQIKELLRLIIKSAVETGTPFIFNRDLVNEANPNKHNGMIYSSNLCVSGDTKILTDKGYQTISTLVDQDVNVWNGEQWSKTTVRKTGGNQELLLVKTKYGKELKCTPYHKFYIECDNQITEVRAHELKKGDKLIKFKLPTIKKGIKPNGILEMQECGIDLTLINSCNDTIESVTTLSKKEDTYCFNEPLRHMGMFNGILTGQCTEIAQNMSPVEHIETTTDGDVVIRKTKIGDFVVCNLASLTLGRIDVNSKDLEETVETVVRMLDNVIDLNMYPLQYAEKTSKKYRAIGLGVSGYHHMLAKNGIRWESQEHLEFIDKIFERINKQAILTSSKLAQEKGSYECFKGSEWENGNYFTQRNYTSKEWQEVKEIVKNGMRNGYLLAIAPTGSTSVISGTSAGIDPIMNKYFLEEKKGSMLPRVAPDLNSDTMWLYKNAHHIDQKWSIKACGVRQRHIDQAQSMNLYITNDYTFRQILDLYLEAYKNGVKTLYYVRSKSLEVEECESCSS